MSAPATSALASLFISLVQIEEEDFARACIDAFSSGLLSYVAEGTTLRAFLSERLQCQPMRGAPSDACGWLAYNVIMKSRIAVAVAIEETRPQLPYPFVKKFHYCWQAVTIMWEGFPPFLPENRGGSILCISTAACDNLDQAMQIYQLPARTRKDTSVCSHLNKKHRPICLLCIPMPAQRTRLHEGMPKKYAGHAASIALWSRLFHDPPTPYEASNKDPPLNRSRPLLCRSQN